MKPTENNKIIKNISFVSLSWAGMFASGFIVNILLARYFGPEGKGQVSLVVGTGMLLATILSLGFDRAVPYYVASNKIAVQNAFGAWLFTALIGVVVMYAVVYPLLAYYLMDTVFDGVTVPLLYLGGLIGPIYIVRLLINSLLAGKEEFVRQTYPNFGMYVVTIISAIFALCVIKTDANGYVLVNAIFCLPVLVIGFIVMKKVVPLKPIFCWADWVKLFRYGIKVTVSQMFNLIDLRLDIYIINYFFGTAMVGIYSIAGALAMMFWMVPQAVSAVLVPRVAATTRENSSKITALLCRNALWQTLICGSIFLLLSEKLIVWVFGSAFREAALALALLMPGVVGQVIAKICYADCCGRGHPAKVTISVAITAIITLTLDIILIPEHKIYGAAIASSIAYCCGAALGLYWHISLSDNKLSNLLLPNKADLALYGKIIKIVKKKCIK